MHWVILYLRRGGGGCKDTMKPPHAKKKKKYITDWCEDVLKKTSQQYRTVLFPSYKRTT